MNVVSRFFRRSGFALTSVVVLLAPWLFGAWEMWWFWPFATLLMAAAVCQGLSWVLGGAAENPFPRAAALLLAAFAPFLIYAFVRFLGTPVYLDAERGFLLHATGLLTALLVLAGAEPRGRRLLLVLIVADLVALGTYGVANHLIDGSRRVLWLPGWPQYVLDDRATGSYVCPDHFAGIMEIAVCIGLAFLLRCGTWTLRGMGAVLVLLGAVGVVMSKSRGGGLTLLVVAAAAVVWGFAQWPREARRWLQVAAVAVMVSAVVLLGCFARGYVERMGRYVGFAQHREKPLREAVDSMLAALKEQDRPLMFAGAVRAWRTAPWAGIGPGMHQHVWPHVGASPDGDRAARRWPSRPFNQYVSNAVHNDWLQLLEEYGVIGFVLFGVPAVLSANALRRRTVAATWSDARSWRQTEAGLDGAMPLAALLIAIAMAFHSLGDFNLQMPGTVWLFAALLALPFGTGPDAPPRVEQSSRRA